jgi:O-antigen/teichoic acid export membrane protein
MLITMMAGLYTSRVVLNTLGVEDFGIYGIVGGIVVLFSFLNNSMTGATQRFLSFEIGKNNFERLKKVFNASINVHLLIVLIIFVLAETAGLWFLNTQLNLPPNKMNVANWVYQFSVITFLISVIQVPYNAIIIAHEKMSFYAYLGIIDVILKLGIVIMLSYIGYNKLKLYAVFICFVSIIIFSSHFVYCIRKFHSVRYIFIRDKILYKELLSFSGWNTLGAISNIGKTQGINILINIFCGVTVNATVAISNQVINALNSFVNNFQTAFNPQIVKTFAANEKIRLYNLIFRTAKYSYFLLFILSLPILLNTQYVLHLWLGTVPYYTVEFCQLTIIYMLIESISGPLWMSQQAIGKIRNYQIIISFVLLMNIPVAYLLLKYSFAPYLVLVGNIGLGIIALGIRILFLKKQIGLSVRMFFGQVIFKIIIVSVISFVASYFVNSLFDSNIFLTLVFSIICIVLLSLCVIYLLGINNIEKLFIKKILKKNISFMSR